MKGYDVWPQKYSNMSHIMTYNPCQFLSTNKNIYQQILSLGY